jgi:hypothetical protein
MGITFWQSDALYHLSREVEEATASPLKRLADLQAEYGEKRLHAVAVELYRMAQDKTPGSGARAFHIIEIEKTEGFRAVVKNIDYNLALDASLRKLSPQGLAKLRENKAIN